MATNMNCLEWLICLKTLLLMNGIRFIRKWLMIMTWFKNSPMAKQELTSEGGTLSCLCGCGRLLWGSSTSGICRAWWHSWPCNNYQWWESYLLFHVNIFPPTLFTFLGWLGVSVGRVVAVQAESGYQVIKICAGTVCNRGDEIRPYIGK